MLEMNRTWPTFERMWWTNVNDPSLFYTRPYTRNEMETNKKSVFYEVGNSRRRMCLSVVFRCLEGMNGRCLIIQSINEWPIIIVKQTNTPHHHHHYHITPIDGWRAVHTSHRNIYGFKFLFWPDRFIVYSPKMFQRIFFTKNYFSRDEIHILRLIHHSTKRKYHTADERFCIYLFISKTDFGDDSRCCLL